MPPQAPHVIIATDDAEIADMLAYMITPGLDETSIRPREIDIAKSAKELTRLLARPLTPRTERAIILDPLLSGLAPTKVVKRLRAIDLLITLPLTMDGCGRKHPLEFHDVTTAIHRFLLPRGLRRIHGDGQHRRAQDRAWRRRNTAQERRFARANRRAEP